METPRDDRTQEVERRSLPPLPKWKAGPFLIDISDRDEMQRAFDEDDETLRPFFTHEDQPR